MIHVVYVVIYLRMLFIFFLNVHFINTIELLCLTILINLEKVGRDFTLSGKEFHNFIVEGKKDLELVCRRHL
jgi:hypothetical protein